MRAAFSSDDVDTTAYFTYMAVIISLLKATPTLPMDSQHQLVHQFLRHLNKISLRIEGRGSIAKASVLDGGVTACFRVLLEQQGSKTSCHELFFVCALQTLCNSIVIPQNLSSSEWVELDRSRWSWMGVGGAEETCKLRTELAKCVENFTNWSMKSLERN